MEFGLIASVIIGYFLSFSLITVPFYKSRANNYLSVSLFLLASSFLIEWIGPVNDLLSFIYYISLDMVIGVFLFTYFLVSIEHKLLKSSWYKWLFAPFVCSVIIEAILHLDSIFHLYESVFAAIVIFVRDNISLGLNLSLMIWIRFLIKGANTISANKKTWLLRLNFLLLLFMFSWLIARIDAFTLDSGYLTKVPGTLIVCLCWWILYYGVFRLQIIAQKDDIHDYLLSRKASVPPIKKKPNEQAAAKIITRLYALMEDEALYKDSMLSRLDIATKLGISEGYLSQIINKEINKSVIQFVNEYRIEDAKNLLHDPFFNKYSVEAIGLEVGFKSKSAFYNAFNKDTEMSPGAYRKLQKTS